MLEYSLYNITINDSNSIVETTKEGLNSFGYFNTATPLYLYNTQPLARKVSNNFMISLPNSANINSLEDLRSYFTTNIFKSYTLKTFSLIYFSNSLLIRFSSITLLR